MTEQNPIFVDESAYETAVNRDNVYVSMTVISQRRHRAMESVLSLCPEHQTVAPTQIFVFVSPDPYLLDQGIRSRDLEIEWWQKIMRPYADYVTIRETSPNIGPYRKLLPLLAEKYAEPNCCILTVDDDQIYSSELIQRYLDTYIHHERKCVIADRAWKLNEMSQEALNTGDYKHVQYPPPSERYRIPTDTPTLYGILTGKGGVLYNPRIFQQVPCLSKLMDYDAIRRLAPTADDLWFYAACVYVGAPIVRPGLPVQEQSAKGISLRNKEDGSWWSWIYQVQYSLQNYFEESLYSSYNKRKNTDQLRRVLQYWLI